MYERWLFSIPLHSISYYCFVIMIVSATIIALTAASVDALSIIATATSTGGSAKGKKRGLKDGTKIVMTKEKTNLRPVASCSAPKCQDLLFKSRSKKKVARTDRSDLCTNPPPERRR